MRLHAHARAVLSHCAGPSEGVAHVCGSDPEGLGSVVGGSRPASSPVPVPVSLLVEDYGQTVHLFLAAVAQGMAVVDALAAFAQVSSGHFSHDDKCFFPENAVLVPVADRIRLLHGAERRVVFGSEGQSDVTLFFVDGVIALIALRGTKKGGPLSRPRVSQRWWKRGRRGRLSLVRWTQSLTRSITRGQLVMPRVSAPS